MPEMIPPPINLLRPRFSERLFGNFRIGQLLLPLRFARVDLRPLGMEFGWKNLTHQGAISSIAAVTKIKFAAPSFCTSEAVRIGPAIAPNEPPTAIKAKSRLACSLLKTSVMKAQKSVTTKRLKTLTQTKKARPTQTFCAGVSVRMRK